MSNADFSSRLANLDFEALKRVMFDRLHGSTSIGPIADPRTEEPHFEWLSNEYRRGQRLLRDHMTEALRDFLKEIGNAARWPHEAAVELLDLLQDCGDDLVDEIRAIVRTRKLRSVRPTDGLALHAGLLRCLLSLGHKLDPDTWMGEFEFLGDDYGAVVFAGLLEHGLEFAVRKLSRLCVSEEAVEHLCLLIPALIDEFGLTTVQRAFRPQLRSCTEYARDALAEALRLSLQESLGEILTRELPHARDFIRGDQDEFERRLMIVMHRAVVLEIETSGGTPPTSDRQYPHEWEAAVRVAASLAVYLATHMAGPNFDKWLWRVCSQIVATAGPELPEDREGVGLLLDSARSKDVEGVATLLAKASSWQASGDRPAPSAKPPSAQ